MRRPIVAAALLAAACLLLAGSTAAQSSEPHKPSIPEGDNAMDTSFASVDLPSRARLEPPRTPFEATVLIKNGSGVDEGFTVMFAFNVLNDALRVSLDAVTAVDGTPLRIAQDNRSDNPLQPKVWVSPDALPADGVVVLKGTLGAKTNGQFHLGVLAIAFDEDYEKLVTPQNEVAEVYGYTLVAVSGIDPAPGQAPFEGAGNVPAPGVGLFLAAVGVGLVLVRRPR